MERLWRVADLVADSRINVLLLGETGVGKEVMATRIHARSERAGKPFVRINCAALPEALLEGELFGYERGAFTGALTSKPGLLQSADGGTVLLDEIGELPMATQVKLLRVIETREITRLGSIKGRQFDVRFLAATNQDPECAVEEGRFRRDLYYRLNGITLAIPPLRKRLDEIDDLTRALLAQLTEGKRSSTVEISESAMARLEEHDWPGNVRELRNVLERALVFAKGGSIELDHIAIERAATNVAEKRAEQQSRPSLKSDVEAVERQRILDALAQTSGNQTLAAKLLGISRRKLVGRLDAYQLPRPRKGNT